MADRAHGGVTASGGTERRFGLSVGGVFLALGLVLVWREHPTIGSILGVPGALLVLGALVVPRWLGPVERGWMRFAAVVGGFNARIILGLAYYLVITPVGLVMRLCGRDPLDRRLRTGDSYWRKRPPEPPATRERYARQY
jgi:hypothetical protein